MDRNQSRNNNGSPSSASSPPGSIYFEKALHLYHLSWDASNIYMVQALGLMAYYSGGRNKLPQAWDMIRQAVTRGIDLGLHRSPSNLKLSSADKEMRRRVWWSIYGLQRSLCTCLGRPMGVDLRDCDVELPLDITDELLDSAQSVVDLPTSDSFMGGFIALTKLYIISDEVSTTAINLDRIAKAKDSIKLQAMAGVVEALDGKLDRWLQEDLPHHIKYAANSTPPDPALFSLSSICVLQYYATMIILHRAFVSESFGSVSHHTSMDRSVAAARIIINFFNQEEVSSLPPSPYISIHVQSCWVSGIIMLRWGSQAKQDPSIFPLAARDVALCADALGAFEGKWPGAARCRQFLLAGLEIQITRDPNNQATTQNGNNMSRTPVTSYSSAEWNAGTLANASTTQFLTSQYSAGPAVPTSQTPGPLDFTFDPNNPFFDDQSQQMASWLSASGPGLGSTVGDELFGFPGDLEQFVSMF